MYRSVVLAVLAAYVLPSAACGQRKEGIQQDAGGMADHPRRAQGEEVPPGRGLRSQGISPHAGSPWPLWPRPLPKMREPEVRREIASTLGSFGSDGATLVDVLAQRLEKDDDAKGEGSGGPFPGQVGRVRQHSRAAAGQRLEGRRPRHRARPLRRPWFFSATRPRRSCPADPDRGRRSQDVPVARIYAVRILAKQSG